MVLIRTNGSKNCNCKSKGKRRLSKEVKTHLRGEKGKIRVADKCLFTQTIEVKQTHKHSHRTLKKNIFKKRNKMNLNQCRRWRRWCLVQVYRKWVLKEADVSCVGMHHTGSHLKLILEHLERLQVLHYILQYYMRSIRNCHREWMGEMSLIVLPWNLLSFRGL